MRFHACFFLLNAISGFQAYARQTTKCDTTEAERAEVMRRTLESLENEYEILPGSLSFPPFAQPAGRYGLGIVGVKKEGGGMEGGRKGLQVVERARLIKQTFPHLHHPSKIVAFDGKVVNPPALCEITSRVDTPYGPGTRVWDFMYLIDPWLVSIRVLAPCRWAVGQGTTVGNTTMCPNPGKTLERVPITRVKGIADDEADVHPSLFLHTHIYIYVWCVCMNLSLSIHMCV